MIRRRFAISAENDAELDKSSPELDEDRVKKEKEEKKQAFDTE